MSGSVTFQDMKAYEQGEASQVTLYGGGHVYTNNPSGIVFVVNNGDVIAWGMEAFDYADRPDSGMAGLCAHAGGMNICGVTESYQFNGTSFEFYQNLNASGSWSSTPPVMPGPGAPPGGPPASIMAKVAGCGGIPGQPLCGDPINVGTGNFFDRFTDYRTADSNNLNFARFYNSRGYIDNLGTFATTIGSNWRSTFDRYLRIWSSAVLSAERADGQVLTFTLSNGTLTTDSDLDVRLAPATGGGAPMNLQILPLGTIWTLTDHDDTVETYTQISATEAILNSIAARNGYTQRLTYNGNNRLVSVTDSYGRTLTLAYSSGLLSTVTTPDGLVLSYGYNSSGVTPNVNDRLASVTYSTSPSSSQTYVYENSSFPFALTGIIDENGNRFATWTYDVSGRATSSQHAGGAELTTITYNDNDGSRVVTNALGQQTLYQFAVMQGVPKVTQITRQ
jgi:YD repeat-containing protein